MKWKMRFATIAAITAGGCAGSSSTNPLPLSNRDKAVALIQSLESGDPQPATYISADRYVQHNLGVADGLEGFAEVIANKPPGGFKANVVRAFEDGDFVFTHTVYDFFGPKIGFDVFRFEDGLIVEHWDNLTDVRPPNPSGRTQVDGPTAVQDTHHRNENKTLVRGFVEEVLIDGQTDKIAAYVSAEQYFQHNPEIADGLEGLGAALQHFADNGLLLEYTRLHRVLGEGNFVLTMSEGRFGPGDHVAYYDLFRVEGGKIVEHWDVIEKIPPPSEWKNSNGKF